MLLQKPFTVEQRCPRPDSHVQARGNPQREDAYRERDGKEGQPDLERVVAKNSLEIYRAEEEHAKDAGDHQHLH